MNQNARTKSEIKTKVLEQLHDDTPDEIISIIVNQLHLANQANQRIEKEGIVVRDMRGSVIAHPAISIEASASKLAADLIYKNRDQDE